MAYSLNRSLAIHEAGHCAAAWLLGHKIKSVHLGDGRSGGIELGRVPGWPAAEALEAAAMIALAGSESERSWNARNPDAPPGWLERVAEGRGHDLQLARAVALHACAGDVDLAKYWLGQHVRGRVLSLTGYGSEDQGDERFWRLTAALAGVLRSEWVLTGREARRVLERAA